MNKVITLAAALEEGLVSPEQVVQVPTSLQVADHTYHDSHPGNLTVTDILAESSNIGTIKLAQQLGEERLDEYLRRFGFGRTTGLGFPHEAPGSCPPSRTGRARRSARSRSARASRSPPCRCSSPTT